MIYNNIYLINDNFVFYKNIYLLDFFNIITLLIYVYIGYLCVSLIEKLKIYDTIIRLLIYVLQPILLIYSLYNIYICTNAHIIDIYVPIIFITVLCLNSIICYLCLNNFSNTSDKPLVVLASNSLNLGYIGGSILIYFFDFLKVIKLVQLASLGSVIYLFTIGIIISSSNIKQNFINLLKSPILYTLIVFKVCITYNISIDFINVYIPILSFSYLKLGLIIFGINIGFFKILDNKLTLRKELFFIIFLKYILLPLLMLVILIFINHITSILDVEKFIIIMLLCICPVAFNLIIFLNFLKKDNSIDQLLNIMFFTTVISIVLITLLSCLLSHIVL